MRGNLRKHTAKLNDYIGAVKTIKGVSNFCGLKCLNVIIPMKEIFSSRKVYDSEQGGPDIKMYR